jgi:8-oxo-dGTP diphosphatase
VSPEPVRRQRFSAYALVQRTGADRPEVLLTQLSGSTTRPGAWTLPGGGVEHGEDPYDAVVREVGEETGLALTVVRLLDVHSLHVEGVAPDGVLEDYHAIRLVFEGTVPADSPEPHVVEQDGTTADARWFPVSAVAGDSEHMVGLVTWALAAQRRHALPVDVAGAPGRH